MNKRVALLLCFIVSAVLLLASCGSSTPATTSTAPVTTTAAPPTTTKATTTSAPSSEKPQYGGTLNLASSLSITTWDPTRNITGSVQGLYLNVLWEGDWARGPAGGYGTHETDWSFANNDLFGLKLGIVAQSWKWTVDAASKTGTIVYQIRPGVHWGLNPDQEASRLVNGRTVTADDVVFSLQRATTWSLAFVFSSNPELRNASITKTGPMEVTATVPIDAVYNALTRFGGGIFIVPPEVVNKYGDLSQWQNQVGTGAFVIKDNVQDSSVTAVRNTAFWMTNPVGPGKGDRLPYIDKVNVLIIPDTSTLDAAVRTGKVDETVPVQYDDANSLRKTPGLVESKFNNWQGRGTPFFLRTDQPPFNNLKVREAMNMAIDRNAIIQSQYGGGGDVFPFPFAYVKEYDAMYYKQADWTPTMKSIYTYNPDGAKKLLADAGYPNGFKVQMTVLNNSSVEQDRAQIFQGFWSKIGVDVTLHLVDPTVKMNMEYNHTHDQIIPETTGPVAVFMVGNSFTGIRYNLSVLNDPTIIQDMADVRNAAITDINAAMLKYRDMTKYALEQAYWVPDVEGPVSNMWWPWLKNYSGEITVGYDKMTWPQYIWIDQNLKKSMGF